MKIEDLRKDYDELQVKYGAKELDSIYNGGCTNNPDICFVFMNPTGRNIASSSNWKGRRSPWIGTKNIWKLFYRIGLLNEDLYKSIMAKKPQEWDEKFADLVNAKKFYEVSYSMNPNNVELRQKIQSLNELNYDKSEYYHFIRE